MTKLIWMSDPHFTKDGDVLGHDPRVRLQAAIDHLNALHADADFCVISGDMVNRGTRTDYAALQARLRSLTVRYLPMVGNHDDRNLLRAALPLPDNCMAHFIQYKLATPQGIIVCLDTKKDDADAGEFCELRRDWLRKTLGDAGDTPVYLFTHHPPMALGLPMQDRENMQNGEAFLDLISDFACVKYLFMGHVHRPTSGMVRGIPFSTMRSVLYQAPPPKPEWNWRTFRPSREAPNVGMVDISDGSVNLQFEQFCEFGSGVMFS